MGLSISKGANCLTIRASEFDLNPTSYWRSSKYEENIAQWSPFPLAINHWSCS